MTKTAIIIPARYGSTRFPGKPLAKIGGRSMLSRVVDVANEASAKFDNVSVHVTTDDERIADHANEINAHCIMTSEACRTGSDRALEAAQQLDEKPDFILNLQGDAPFTPVNAIEAVLQRLTDHPETQVATPVYQLSWVALTRFRTSKETTPFSGTCAAYGKDGKAFWFSKNIIPAIRKEALMREEMDGSPVYQHMGLYGYSYAALEKFCALPEGYYEKMEGLEQLRLIENGIPIHCVEIKLENENTISGIDTPEDLKRAEKLLNE